MATTPDNQISALDVFVRQQAYLEGYKNDQSNEAERLVLEVITLITLMLMKTGKTSVADLSKRELVQFNAELTIRLTFIFAKFDKAVTAQFKKFFSADFSMSGYIFKQLGGKTYRGKAAASLWADFQQAPTPGVGTETKSLFKTFFQSAGNRIIKTIKIAYAENWSIAQTIEAVKGTASANYKDGILRTLTNQLSATIDTYIQSMHSFLLYTIGSTFFDYYQWVSVLDGHTSAICIDRNGNVYKYGDGPRPPAHYRCRSSIVPVAMSNKGYKLPTFFAWISAQPLAIQDELLGQRIGIRLRKGEVSSDDLPSFSAAKGLTLDEYKGKRNSILTANKEAA